MRPSFALVVGLLLLAGWLIACVDSFSPDFQATVNVLVVDGTINNLAEAQVIRLNRSKADPVTGRFGNFPITKATVAVVVDSMQIIGCHETVDGSYELPSDFKGQVGHSYQLRFTLTDGTRYESNPQIMPAVPAIDRVTAQFNPKSIFPPLPGQYTAGHDLFVDFKDPADTHNYYRWDWKLYEKQAWCRSCYQGIYSIYTVTAELRSVPDYGNYYIYFSDNNNNKLLENCYYELTPPQPSRRNPVPEYQYDYTCRTKCWEIIYSHDINIFDDQLTNGGLILRKPVAHIPYYTHEPALAEIRQSALTAGAYRYAKQIQDQTQNTGGIADTPPAALIGNVHNVANQREAVVGYFTASAVAASRYWLDRKDAVGVSLGGTNPAGYIGLPGEELFYALNIRQPNPEPVPPQVAALQLLNGPLRPPTALCVPGNTKTPFKPEGWRD